MNRKNTLVAGIGSPHGDDQLGWLVAGRLVALSDPERVVIRLLRSPIDLLDWSDEIQQLFICDACRGLGQVGAISCWNWPAPELSDIELSGTHDLSLPAVLTLAERLGRLPERVSIWAIEGASSKTGQAVTGRAMEAVSVVVNQIAFELKNINPTPAIPCMSNRSFDPC